MGDFQRKKDLNRVGVPFILGLVMCTQEVWGQSLTSLLLLSPLNPIPFSQPYPQTYSLLVILK